MNSQDSWQSPASCILCSSSGPGLSLSTFSTGSKGLIRHGRIPKTTLILRGGAVRLRVRVIPSSLCPVHWNWTIYGQNGVTHLCPDSLLLQTNMTTLRINSVTTTAPTKQRNATSDVVLSELSSKCQKKKEEVIVPFSSAEEIIARLYLRLHYFNSGHKRIMNYPETWSKCHESFSLGSIPCHWRRWGSTHTLHQRPICTSGSTIWTAPD